MIAFFKNTLNHPYIRGSSVNFIGSLGVNFLSYIFNIIIGRMLGPNLYSEYFSMVSIWYLATLPSAVLQTALTKQIAHYAAKDNAEELKQALQVGTKIALTWGLGIGFGLMLASPLILIFLKSQNIIAFTLLIMLIVLGYLNIPFLSMYIAKEKYITFSILSGSGILFRTLCVLPLLFINTSVVNVFIAILIGGLIQLYLSIHFVHREIESHHQVLKRILNYLQKLTRRAIVADAVNKDITRALKTSFIATLGLAALTQSDILLARARLSPDDAGMYASLAVLGKIIPFFTLPLIGVLLPQITGKIARNEEYRSTIRLAVGLVSTGSIFVATIYAVFPTFVISIFGSAYLNSAPYLGIFGVFQTLYALTALGVMACIAMNRFKAASFILVSSTIQLILILITPPTILNTIYASIAATTISVLYYGVVLFKKS